MKSLKIKELVISLEDACGNFTGNYVTNLNKALVIFNVPYPPTEFIHAQRAITTRFSILDNKLSHISRNINNELRAKNV